MVYHYHLSFLYFDLAMAANAPAAADVIALDILAFIHPDHRPLRQRDARADLPLTSMVYLGCEVVVTSTGKIIGRSRSDPSSPAVQGPRHSPKTVIMDQGEKIGNEQKIFRIINVIIFHRIPKAGTHFDSPVN